MPVITCPTCGTKLEVDADHLGREVQCGSCQQVFTAAGDRGAGRSRGSKFRRDEDAEDDRPSRPSSRRNKYRREDADADDDDYDYAPRPRTRTGRNPGTGMGVAALILGIAAVVMAVCCWPVGGVCAVLAIIFGCVSLNTQGRGMGIAGIGIGVLSILLAVLMLVVGFGMGMFNALNAPKPAPPPPVRFR